MAIPRIRFTSLQLSLLVALVAILVRAGILFSRPSGRPVYSVTALAFSPDGKTLAASLFIYRRVEFDVHMQGTDASHSFFILDMRDLHAARLVERNEFPGRLGPASDVQKQGLGQSLAISPDGKLLATNGTDDRVSLWDIASGHKLRDVPAHTNLHTGALSWAEDGSLAVGTYFGVYVDGPNAAASANLSGAVQGCDAVVLSRDCTELATANDEGRIELWDTQTHTRRFELEHGDWELDRVGLAISPNGKLVAGGVCGAGRGKDMEGVRVWDAVTGKKIASFMFNERPSIALAFSPDGSTLAGADDAKGFCFYNLADAHETIVPTTARIASVAYSPDGSQFATGDFAGEVSLWDPHTKKLLNRVSLVPWRDATDSWSWPIVIAASVVWLAAWTGASVYAGRKRRQRANARNAKESV